MDPWHHLYLSNLHAVSLYASPIALDNVGLVQWVIPGFDAIYQPSVEVTSMKGMWSSEKSDNATYRPALDALKAVNADLLAEALLAVLENGCAFMVSATRDHGAICLTLLDGDKRHKVYPATVTELDAALRDLIDSFKSEASTVKARASKR